VNIKTAPTAYGNLCSIFYDITKKYAPEREVDFYASFMPVGQGRILEAMSGSGRLQIPLLQRGYVVDGVDNSPIMLERCKQRCAQLQLTPELYLQSLEKLVLPYKYITVTIAVGSFQLITDRSIALQSLKNIHAHMHKDGNLLIDIFVPDTTFTAPSTSIARIDNHSVIRNTTRYIFDEQSKQADAFCCYELITNGVVIQQENELIQIVWYTYDEFIRLLEEAGFDVIKIYEESFRQAGPSHIVHACPA
jgi:SAM-dependent methyltransferase